MARAAAGRPRARTRPWSAPNAPADAVLAGVDVGGTKIQVVVTDAGFRRLGESRAQTPRTGGPPAVVRAIGDLVAQALADAGRPRASAVGVGAPGTIDCRRGIVSRSPNLAGWMDPFPLAAELAKLVGAPVSVDNDVRAGMLGEHRLGAARPFSDVIGVWFGTGVGGAVILGGELRRGRAGACGEIGHACVRPGGRRCGCGRRGCLEAYAGRASMERRARRLAGRGRETQLFRLMERLERDHVTSGVLARALEHGDALAHQLLDRAVWAAGAAIASAVNVLDVEAVVIGGGLGSRLGAPFVHRIASEMQPHLFVDGDSSVRVLPAALGDYAGALGAATQAAESIGSTARRPGR
ncbi:MAG TPA: ROK family protein [Candidatus Dormibacteraeota bacterium]|nr:ROK family protein [Candidatus Dormibacteraeota bacterium]